MLVEVELDTGAPVVISSLEELINLIVRVEHGMGWSDNLEVALERTGDNSYKIRLHVGDHEPNSADV